MANKNKNVMRGKTDRFKKAVKDAKKQWSRDKKANITDESQYVASGPNDLNWYVSDEQILNDAARIPYSIPVGMPFVRNGKVTVNTGETITLPSYDDAIPGLMVSWIVPLLGNAHDPSDATNVAANAVYQFVRSRISGSRPYDAVDMMMYLGAMDSIFCFVTWITRLYGTIFTYHQSNRYLSRYLVEAQNVDYDDLVANLSAFRAQVNIEIAKIRALYLPAILPIFKRHSWLFSHYYIEGESEKDQIYFHTPAGIHHFKFDDDGAGMLECYNLMDTDNPFTAQGIINTLRSLINPVFQDEDFNRISGDFLKAYEGNVFTISEIPDIGTIQLLHSEEVLLQFKNAKYKTVRPYQDKFPFFDYKQSPDKLYLQMDGTREYLMRYINVEPTHNRYWDVTSSTTNLGAITDLAVTQYEFSKDILLTSPRKDVTPGESMINTRLTLAFDISEDSSSMTGLKFEHFYFGSEWPIEYRIHCVHRSKTTGVISMFWRRYDYHLNLYNHHTDLSLCESWMLSQEPIRSAFKYLPELSISYTGASSLDQNTRYVDPGRSVFEVDNYALVNQTVIGGLHNAAILGEYNIPKLAISK